MHSQRPRLFFLGIVFISLAAHGLALQLPWRNSSTADSGQPVENGDAAEPTSEAIAITRLPAQPQPPITPSPQQPSQTTSRPAKPPALQAAQLAPPQIEPPAPQITQPQPSLDPTPAPAEPEPIAPPPASAPPEEPEPELPTQSLLPLAAEPTQPQKPEPEHDAVVQLGDRFPHFQGSQSGCYGLQNCHRIAGEGTYRQAAKKLIEQMKNQGYQVSERDDIDSQGHRVFAISPPDEPNETYYLNVFSDSSDSMVYAVTLEIMSLVQLQQLNGQAAL